MEVAILGRVTICGIDTSALPKLNSKECDALLKKIKAGDKEARDLFLRANMRLVLSCVGRFSKSQESADDLFQVGMVGLLKALENFDISLDVRFSTYAVPMILGEIRRVLRDRTSIKVSRSMRDTAYKALKARERMIENSVNEPNMVEIAEEIGVPISEVACALDAVSEPISFYEPVYSDGEESLALLDQLADKKENSDNWSEKISLYEALKEVPERELEVIKMRYFDGRTQIEISQEVGISQAQVSRLEKSALERIRTALA
ncbi:MAG: sigma-70 family RNA polymerase sigma factor [Clostridia bacterium]|jgi:RNA polymerase sporulation-specific sigma factor|nr:sigma-70 family RNA polymerase sigma factor [Clostridia bacterium]